MTYGVNWGLLNGVPDAGNALMQGLQYGAQMRQKQEVGNALRAYATNPNDPSAVAGVIQRDPVLGMRLQEDQRVRAETARKRKIEEEGARRELIIKGAQIIRQFNPTDDATWQQARAAAAQMGIPIDQVPATFDPNYVKQIVTAADALQPEKQETITVDGIVLDKRTMQPLYESPYPRVISGAGGVHVQPRIGISGLRGGTAPTAGQVIPAPGGLPQGWQFEDDGGPDASPGNFP